MVNRSLSEFELSYLDELALYDKVLILTGLISLNQHDILTDGRGIRSVKIFTRQTLTALSLSKLLPRPDPSKSSDSDFWDVCSIASLTRNLIEGYLGLYYYGIEPISDSEAELRFFLLQLHKNIEWYNIRKNEMDAIETKQFEDGIAEQKGWIKNHNFLCNLNADQKKRALSGMEMYKSKLDFEAEIPICKSLRRDYRHLSNLVHPLPLSIERTDNIRGRGLGSDADVNYCLLSLMHARRYLAASVVGIVDKFPNELGKKFKNEIIQIRPLLLQGFDE